MEPNAYVEAKNESGIPSVFRWKYQPMGNATRLTLDIEYSIPTPVLGKLAEAIVVKMNEHETDTMLKNIKAALEDATQPRTNGAHAHA